MALSPDMAPGARADLGFVSQINVDELTTDQKPTDVISTSDFRPDFTTSPQALTPERYQALSLVGKRVVDLALLRAGDEGSIAKLSKLEPEFEMQYPLSSSEEIVFRSFEGYVNEGIAAAGYLGDSMEPEILDALNEEKQRRINGELNPRHHTIVGFKTKRWERWTFEEQIRLENRIGELGVKATGGTITDDEKKELDRMKTNLVHLEGIGVITEEEKLPKAA